MSVSDVVRLKVLADGTELSQEHQVLSATVTRTMNRIPAAQILVYDGDAASAAFPLSDGELLAPGCQIEVQAGFHEQDATIFKGIVVGQGIQVRRGRPPVLAVECRDQAVKMTVGRKSKVFTDMTDADVLSAVAQASGLPATVGSTTAQHGQIVQVHSSDWDFLLERANANGLGVFADDGALAIKRPDTSASPVARLAYGEELYDFEVETDARDQFDGVKGAAWNPSGQALLSADGTPPSFAPPGNQSPATLAGVIGHGPLQLWHGGALLEAEIRDWASGALLRSRLALVRGRARCQGRATVKPGTIVELLGVGQRFSGNVLVTGVRHQVTTRGWEMDVQFGLPTASLLAPPVEDRPAAGLVPAMPGLQVGVVKQLEGDPAGEERIQITLPLVGAASDGVWARLASLDAGDNRGWVFRPEIGDEVVVGFLHGDPRCPVVLGMLHSSAKPAPLPAADANDQKGLVTRSEMKVTFDDDKKSVTVETPGGNKVVVSDDAQGIALEDQNGNKLTMNADGVAIESAGKLALKAQGEVTLEGASISMKAQSDMKVEGANLSLKASAQLKSEGSAGVELTSSAITTIKGSLVQIN